MKYHYFLFIAALVATLSRFGAAQNSDSASSVFSSSPLSVSSFFSSSSRDLSDLWTESSSSSLDNCLCTSIKSEEEVCLYLDEIEAPLRDDDDDDDAEDDDASWRPRVREGPCRDEQCQCHGSLEDLRFTGDAAYQGLSTSSISTSSISFGPRGFDEGEACAFAAELGDACAACARDDGARCHCITEADTPIVIDASARNRGVCVVIAPTVNVPGITFTGSPHSDSFINGGRITATSVIDMGDGDDVVVAVAGSSTIQSLTINTDAGDDRVHIQANAQLSEVNLGDGNDRLYVAPRGSLSMLNDAGGADADDDLIVIGGTVEFDVNLAGGEFYLLGCGIVRGTTNHFGAPDGLVVFAAATGAQFNDFVTLSHDATVETFVVRLGSRGDSIDLLPNVDISIDAVVYSSGVIDAMSIFSTAVAPASIDVLLHTSATVFSLSVIAASPTTVVAHDNVQIGGGLGIDSTATASVSIGNNFFSPLIEIDGEVTVQIGRDAAISTSFSLDAPTFSLEFGPGATINTLTVVDGAAGDAPSSLSLESGSSISFMDLSGDMIVVLSGTHVQQLSHAGGDGGDYFEHYWLCSSTAGVVAVEDAFTDGAAFFASSVRTGIISYGSPVDIFGLLNNRRKRSARSASVHSKNRFQKRLEEADDIDDIDIDDGGIFLDCENDGINGEGNAWNAQFNGNEEERNVPICCDTCGAIVCPDDVPSCADALFVFGPGVKPDDDGFFFPGLDKRRSSSQDDVHFGEYAATVQQVRAMRSALKEQRSALQNFAKSEALEFVHNDKSAYARHAAQALHKLAA